MKHKQIIGSGRPTFPSEAVGNLLTRREVADRLAVCYHTVMRLTARGLLPAVRIGRTVRYRAADVAGLTGQR